MRSAKLCPAFFLFASCLSAQALRRQSTKEGLALLHKMQESLGGSKRLAGVHDYEETIRAVAWDAAGNSLGEVRKRTRWIQNPSTLRLDQVGPRGTYVLYLDGRSGTGWEILPDLKSSDAFKTTGSCRSNLPACRSQIRIVLFPRRCVMRDGKKFPEFASLPGESTISAA